jgi:hypothetical protein
MEREGMIETRALLRAIAVGTFLEVAAAAIAHFSLWIQTHALLFTSMMISAIMGYLYAQDVAKGYLRGAWGGAIAGGTCGLGIVLSVVLGDVTARIWAVRVLVCVLTGAVGGIYGQMAADWP